MKNCVQHLRRSNSEPVKLAVILCNSGLPAVGRYGGCLAATLFCCMQYIGHSTFRSTGKHKERQIVLRADFQKLVSRVVTEGDHTSCWTFIGPCIAVMLPKLQPTRCYVSWFFYFYRRSTCFTRFLRPSSGAHNCTYSFRYCHPILLLAAASSSIGWQYLKLYVQFSAPEDGQRNRLKHEDHLAEVNRTENSCIFLVVLWEHMSCFWPRSECWST